MFEWIQQNVWVIWALIAGGLAVSEMLTLDMTLLMLAGGALAGVGVALFFPGLLWLQILVAVIVGVALLGLLRPEILKRLHKGPGYRSTFEQLLGASGRAAGEITATSGEATINGETWTARSWDGQTIAEGVPVDVMEVDGLVVVVHPRGKALGAD
ncbi:MAG: NfeD family protein [Propionibacteriaceae bacterium]|nr:NfeD family protein [Propionibacteriaceae bacterium]